MYKMVLNQGFENFEAFVIDVASHFRSSNESIHKARNELKIIEANNVQTIVKSFKTPHFLRKIIYSYFRDSKAKKSYEYSLRLGDFTPKPIAYIEFFENGLLGESYFVSEKFSYDFTIREPLLDKNFADKEKILQSFAHFSYLLHQEGILHLDYSPGNILIKKEDNNYIFKVVDVNRMEFGELCVEQRLQNFNKLWANDEEIAIIAQAYAKLIGEEEQNCIKLAQDFNNAHKNKMRLKKRLKGQKLVD